jgi:uncharacterized protein YdeI (YjbR/CyaY-like superfamily)
MVGDVPLQHPRRADGRRVPARPQQGGLGAARAEAGDEVEVVIALDTAPREVEVPPALQRALDADAEAKGIYEALAFTHRKEFARWVAEAKKDETRDRRVVQTLEMLRAGRTRS